MYSEDKNTARGNRFEVSRHSCNPTLTALAFACALLLVAIRPAQAQTLTTLLSFPGTPDGANPVTGVIFDAAGNLYGTTDNQGSGDCGGCGVVFKLSPSGEETVLYNFQGGAEGDSPYAGVVRGKKGYLYGATLYSPPSYGTLYKVSPKGVHTVLYSFTGGADGADPYGENLIFDKAGNLYGTGYSGGAYEYGVVFELTASGTERVLYSFTGGVDGGLPYAGVVEDKLGNFYGTTLSGGDLTCNPPYGCGTVFKLDPAGLETVLHSFSGGPDGATPYGGLALDKKGNLYGTTAYGGPSNAGTVFMVSPTGAETVLYAFTGGGDGNSPTASVIRDEAGNLYGTTPSGGAFNNGTVFEVSSSGTETVLHSFTGGVDGNQPVSGLIFDKEGNLYGTTIGGGVGFGVVYKVTP